MQLIEELFEELEELLVMGDMGVNTAGFICDRLRQRIKEKGITDPSLIMGELKAIVSDMRQDVLPFREYSSLPLSSIFRCHDAPCSGRYLCAVLMHTGLIIRNYHENENDIAI